MKPSSAPVSADAGSVIQNGACISRDEDADREGAGGDQAGMAERDLPGIAGQQHQRERADRGEKDLAGEIEREGRRDERKRQRAPA